MGRSKQKQIVEGRVKKDSELFKPLVAKAERYLRDYCDGEQDDDNKAKIALRVLSVYRKILKVERERAEIKSEWEKLMVGVSKLRKISKRRPKQRPKKGEKAGKSNLRNK